MAVETEITTRTIARVLFWSALLLMAIPFVLVKGYPSLQRMINIDFVTAVIMFLEKQWLGWSFIICPLAMLVAVLLRICTRSSSG